MKNLKDTIKKICPRPVRAPVQTFLRMIRKTRKRQGHRVYGDMYKKYKGYTMIPEDVFYGNLDLAKMISRVKGLIVECGVWRGGMIGSIAETLVQTENMYYSTASRGYLPHRTKTASPQKMAGGQKVGDIFRQLLRGYEFLA